jgi:release factor glutamine methyltransferase
VNAPAITVNASTITWRQLWVEASRTLGDEREARWLCQEASGLEGVEWLSALDVPATQRTVAHLDAMVERRRGGEPLAYVLGHWAFRTLELMVDNRVLIPRPETELVAERALAESRARLDPHRAITVVDLGTGSGAIALSLAAELPRGRAEVWATDASAEALDVASANLACLPFGVAPHVRVAQGDWFGALPQQMRGECDVVVSNPPYVAIDDPDLDESVLQWEPANALFAGTEGLDALGRVVEESRVWLRPTGALVLEIGARQAPAVTALARAAGFSGVDVVSDLAGRDRIVVCW